MSNDTDSVDTRADTVRVSVHGGATASTVPPCQRAERHPAPGAIDKPRGRFFPSESMAKATPGTVCHAVACRLLAEAAGRWNAAPVHGVPDALQARKSRRALAKWERVCDERGHGVVLWDGLNGGVRVLIQGVTKTAVVTIGEPASGAPGARRGFCLRSGARIGGNVNERATLRVEAAQAEVLRSIVAKGAPGTEWLNHAARLLAAAGVAER